MRDREQDKDAYMILASDGVWEFISSQQAVDLIKGCKTAEEVGMQQTKTEGQLVAACVHVTALVALVPSFAGDLSCVSSLPQACKLLVEESTRRWQAEEEVIDDITAVVVYF